MMTAGAMTNGYDKDTRLNCSSSFQVGNRAFKNYESGAYGSIGFDKALEVPCNTFFYRIGYDFWSPYGRAVADVNAQAPLVSESKAFGIGADTRLHRPGEARGRSPDRKGHATYGRSPKDHKS